MKTVLVVDDSRFVYNEIKQHLHGTAFKVIAYSADAAQAMAAYKEHKPDLVLMDIILPGMDGLLATQALISKWPKARVVIISSLAHQDTIKQAMKNGARGFIFKPFDKETLLDNLQQAMKGAAPFIPQL